MENAKISIIVPAYNIEEYLGRCLDSLLNQTYQNLEIIVVDDGSSDGTGHILDEYANKDDRIIAIHQKNQGVSVARNHGLDFATGDYIGFTDGDDLVEADMFEFLVHILEEKSVDIAHCGYQMVFPNRVDYYYNTGNEELFDHDTGLYELLKGTRVEPGLWNKLYRKELFKNIRLPIGVAETEDLKCNFDLFNLADASYYVDIPKYHYMIRNGSATTTGLSEKKRRDRYRVVKYIYKKSIDNPVIKSVAYEKYIRILLENAQQNDWKDLKEESIIKLKRQFKNILLNKNLGKKIKGMIFGSLYLPGVYRIVRKVYEKKTGINHKYDI